MRMECLSRGDAGGTLADCGKMSAAVPLTRRRRSAVGSRMRKTAGSAGAAGGSLALARRVQAALRVVLATWVAIASISAGDRQS